MPSSRGADRRAHQQRLTLAELGITKDRRSGEDRRERGFISRLQLFVTIPYEAIEAVIIDTPLRSVSPGEILLEPGQSNDAIHLLVHGRLRIHLDRADSNDFIPIEEGGCFGELSIIDGRPVSAYVVADCDSRILTVPAKVFWERMAGHPGVARNLLRVLSERMRANGEIILERLKDKHALELLQKELSIAHDIQMSMLPPGNDLMPDSAGVQACALMEPAKNVGGDFYDAFVAAPGRLFFAVGDVSGKGVPAALFMARAITQLRMEAVRRRSPAAILEAVNRALCAGNDAGMFVTLFCGMLDTATGDFTYANAGHNPPLLLDANGGAALLEVAKGLVAGFVEDARYREKSLHLVEGQSVLMYTDGVTEAMNTADECYAEERFLDIAGSRQWQDPLELIKAVREDIAAFVKQAPQADDITLLAMRRSTTGPG
jgi:sigma-B regulation protein RsbU (phosphoserine phosphatase)